MNDTSRAQIANADHPVPILEELGQDRWRCPVTELVVVAPPATPVWRVYRTLYGSPLNPLRRTAATGKDTWNRFDLPDHVTVYGASDPRGAYLESLAYAQMPSLPVPWSEIFDDVAEGEDPVADDWSRLFHMRPGQIPATWRADREMAEMFLLRDGHFVDLSVAETLGALRRSAGTWAAPYVSDPAAVDMARLTGADRLFTTAAAAWLADQVLADGRPPRGIKYVSKHGTDMVCWALWVPLGADEDPADVVSKYAWCATSRPIDEVDADLSWAARQLNLRVW